MNLQSELRMIELWQNSGIPADEDVYRCPMQMKMELLWQCHATLTMGPEIMDLPAADRLLVENCTRQFVERIRGNEFHWIDDVGTLRQYLSFTLTPVSVSTYSSILRRLDDYLNHPSSTGLTLGRLPDSLAEAMKSIFTRRRSAEWKRAFVLRQAKHILTEDPTFQRLRNSTLWKQQGPLWSSSSPAVHHDEQTMVFRKSFLWNFMLTHNQKWFPHWLERQEIVDGLLVEIEAAEQLSSLEMSHEAPTIKPTAKSKPLRTYEVEEFRCFVCGVQ